MFQINEYYILGLAIMILVYFGIQHEEQFNQELEEAYSDNCKPQLSVLEASKSCYHHSTEFGICSKMLKSVDYEVFGRVQGVFFRKYTASQAKELGLKGYVMNTRRSTVVGTIQGDSEKINEMKRWLQTTGSPHCRIDRCEFKNEKSISSMEYKDFSVKH